MTKEEKIAAVEKILNSLRDMDSVIMPAMAARKLVEAENLLETARKMLLIS